MAIAAGTCQVCKGRQAVLASSFTVDATKTWSVQLKLSYNSTLKTLELMFVMV